ncbi:antibiotic biosynthesis monooxygenase family protein [Pseudoroseomonas wenyumeiae]
MITEFALLHLLPGSGSAFVAAFANVAPLLTNADGYIRHRLVPALENADLYLLVVDWRDVAAHTQGSSRAKPTLASWRLLSRCSPATLSPSMWRPGRSRDAESFPQCVLNRRWLMLSRGLRAAPQRVLLQGAVGDLEGFAARR